MRKHMANTEKSAPYYRGIEKKPKRDNLTACLRFVASSRNTHGQFSEFFAHYHRRRKPVSGYTERCSISRTSEAHKDIWEYILLFSTGYATVGIAAPWIFQALNPWISQLLCSCNVILLIITGIFLQYLVHQVQKIRLQGYYMFSQRLKHIVRLPFSTISYGTAGMLLLVVWEPKISFLSASGLLRIVMLVEVVIAGTFMALYIGYVHQYNSLDSQPDVMKSLYSPLQPSSSLEGLRYYDGRLADQQMALLQYQRENIHFLCDEILRLQECLSKYETSSGGIAPQVDLAHLLAARDQELRTLSAEMDHLQSELQLARSVIAEKDGESHRIRVTNNQYIEENERLRAILGEWSTRAAKLERALEAERVLNLDLQKNIMRLKNRSSEAVEPSQKD